MAAASTCCQVLQWSSVGDVRECVRSGGGKHLLSEWNGPWQPATDAEVVIDRPPASRVYVRGLSPAPLPLPHPSTRTGFKPAGTSTKGFVVLCKGWCCPCVCRACPQQRCCHISSHLIRGITCNSPLPTPCVPHPA